MRWGAVLVMVVLSGCDRGEVRAVLGEVELSARALRFEPTFLGYPTSRPLVLRNGSRAGRTVRLELSGPFSTELEVQLPGGSERELQVRFEPRAEGPATGTVALSDGTAVVEVALDGLGVRAPACVPSAPCLASAFDPRQGACVESAVADGTTCQPDNACFLGGSCTRGLCLGSARDCGDTNRCTVDACDPAGGCLHLPLQCAAPADPCKVASCDPVLGCIEADAADGTACGPADCSTAQICLLGKCKSLPVPDGASCAPASACQGAGTCRQQSCERPAATPLVEAWSYQFPGMVSGFRGVADPAENLYWIECAFGGFAGQYCDACTLCAATSYTRDGQLRFRQVLTGAAGYEPEPLHLIAGGQLVYAMPYSVGAVAIADGTPLWTRDFYAPLPNAPDVATVLEVKAMAADPTGVYLLALRYQGNTSNPRQSVLLKLDPSTGVVGFTQFFDGALTGMVLDEQNNLYLGLLPRAAPNPIQPLPLLISLNSGGTERWRVMLPSGGELPVAAYQGEVILQGGEVHSTIDGTLRAEAPLGGLIKNALIGPGHRTLLVDPPPPCCPTCKCAQLHPRVEAIRLKSGSAVIDWQTNIANRLSGIWGTVSDSVATRQGDLLIAGASYDDPAELIALSSSGAKRFSCELPTGGSSHFRSAVALLSGRWAVVEEIECLICTYNPNPRLRVFEVPGERPTAHGWVGALGSPSGAARPLP